MQVSLSAILAEANSADPWTSRARPTFLYVIYGIILLCVIGAIIGIWWPQQTFHCTSDPTFNPDNPLAPSFPRRRETSELYTPQSGQNLDF